MGVKHCSVAMAIFDNMFKYYINFSRKLKEIRILVVRRITGPLQYFYNIISNSLFRKSDILESLLVLIKIFISIISVC